MAVKLHIDIETYSPVDIKTAGAYKYIESQDFEILIIAYAFDDEPVDFIDVAGGEKIHDRFINALQDPTVEKHAHNAVFERQAFKRIGYDVSADQWYCSAIKAAYCGFPLSLEAVSKAMKLEEKGKLATGKALIRYFSIPCKPTKANGQRTRNYPHHDLDRWGEYIRYCINDVEAEREIDKRLEVYKIPELERLNYILDQEINDRGILIDLVLAENAFKIDNLHVKELKDRMVFLTGLENPGSVAQLKGWLSKAMKKEITTLAKDAIKPLLKEAEDHTVSEVLQLRSKVSKSSTKKYTAMRNCACEDSRARGVFQFYGANRTGRWAGRLIQLQNLPQNHLSDLELAREVVKTGDYELFSLLYDNPSSILSQLIRTAFIAPRDKTFIVADFSAIEARVIAWLAGESWRLDVFNTHGKIYEASAALMFNIPIEQIGKGSELRQKGKVAELALGYQGAVGALTQMGGESMGLSETEMVSIVEKWRRANPSIVGFWKNTENCVKAAVRGRKKVVGKYQNLIYDFDGQSLTIELPSGRKLFYQEPGFTLNKFGQESIRYKGMDQTTKQWQYIDSYGGKFVENVTQAIARDLLAVSMLRLKKAGFKIVMHVHDESVCEVPTKQAETKLRQMCEIMSAPVKWAEGLPLAADGYITPFYKKD